MTMTRAALTLSVLLLASQAHAWPIGTGSGRCVCHLEQIPAVLTEVAGPELSDADQLAAEQADLLHEPAFDPNFKPASNLMLVCVHIDVASHPKPEGPGWTPETPEAGRPIPELPSGLALLLGLLAGVRRLRRRGC